MTTIEQLRQTLAEQQKFAPSGDDLLHAVHVVAAKRMRRRRGATWATSGLAVLAVLTALAVVARQPLPNQPHTAATASPAATATESPSPTPTPTGPPYRQPGEITLGLVSGSGYFTMGQGINGSFQFMTLRAKPGAAVSFGGDVHAYDPGTFDASKFLAGQPLVIEGQTTNAYYVERYHGSGIGAGPAIGWQDASGVWIEVSGDQNKDGLVRLAQDVRLTPPQEFKTAFHLTYVPSGLHLVYMGREESMSLRSRIGFNERPGSIDAGALGPSRKVAIEVDVLPRDDYIDSHTNELGAPTSAGNLEVHYVTGANSGGLMVPNGGTIINIRNNKCNAMIIILDSARFSRAEQERIVAGFQFADCKRQQTWIRPV
jgi:hypothetical protein